MICPLFPEPTFLIFAEGVPELLYYSHIPAIVVALLVGFFVFLNARELLLSRLLLVISVCFSLWCFINLMLWTNVNSDSLLFAWSFLRILSSLISIFSIYFIYVFLYGKDVSRSIKEIFFALLLPVIILAPTDWNVAGFDLTNCDAFLFEGLWYKYYYVSLGVIAMLWILLLLIREYRTATVEFRKQIVYMGLGIELFLFLFFTLVFLAAYLIDIGLFKDSRIELYGLFGMPIFMAFIAALIVRFKTFNVGMLAAQALVIALVILIGSMFTFADNVYNIVLIGITLALTGAIGIVLVRSVKREVQQRELIQKQEQELEVVNKQQENLLHFISHEVKAYLTESQAGFAGIVEGDYGPTEPKLKSMAEYALAKVRKGVATVMDILQASDMKKGTMEYKKSTFNLQVAVIEVVNSLKPSAQGKGIDIKTTIDRHGRFTLSGDEEKIRQQVLRNLIDNAIRYTPSGTIRVELGSSNEKIRFAVSDSGVGITPEDMAKLFTEGGHGKDSIKVNVHSTGYGLFIAKQVVDAHGGKIWAESEGAGKGAKFIVELPVV
jgi:signal transduction histidine kinase